MGMDIHWGGMAILDIVGLVGVSSNSLINRVGE